MSICQRCGHDAGESKFCPECGCDLRVSQQTNGTVNSELGSSPTQPTIPPASSNPKTPSNETSFQHGSYDKPASAKAQKKSRMKVIIGIVAALAIIGMIGSIGGGTGDSGATDPQPNQAATANDNSNNATNKEAEEKQKAEEGRAEAKSELEKVISDAAKTNAADYTPESFQALVAACENGTSVISNESSTESDFDDAKSKIIEAQVALKAAFKPENYSWPAYADVARTPDSYKGQLMAFTGKVIQVVEGTSEVNLRVATDGSYGDVILVGYDPAIMGGTRVLEDDIVTVYGTCIGLYTYESTLGASISIPGLYADSVVIG